MGCFATWRADITTAWEPWYLELVVLVGLVSVVQREEDTLFIQIPDM